MNLESFNAQKEKLISLIEQELLQCSAKEQSLLKLMKILKQYDYEKSNKIKGLLTRVIIDSSVVDFDLGEKLINFDSRIK